MEFFLLPESRAFAITAVLLVGLVGIETIMLLVGLSLGELVEHSMGLGFGHGHDTDQAGGLNWLNVGGVPLLVLLMLALGAFSATGFAIQAASTALAGTPLPGLVASGAALALAVPAVRASSRIVARLVPRDESYAVELADFVGRTAEVSVGPLDDRLPGTVTLKDAHGNWHKLRARAAKGAEPMPAGAKVLLVDLSAGVFAAIPAPPDLQS